MNEVVLSAQVPNQRRAAGISSRLPGKSLFTTVDLLEELFEVENIFAVGEEGFGTLKHDDFCLKNLGYFFRAVPASHTCSVGRKLP
ncbi:MAG: hypothetical protein ACJ74Y_12235 [Bryobacteraceae bacterium]